MMLRIFLWAVYYSYILFSKVFGQVFCHFLLGVRLIIDCVFILDMYPLSDIYFKKQVFTTLWLFICSIVSFEGQEFWIVIKLNL